MISFSSNGRVALRLIRSAISTSSVPIVFLCAGAFGSGSAQEVRSGRSEAAEFQKVEPALKFQRERNARTYAISTANGIDESAESRSGESSNRSGSAGIDSFRRRGRSTDQCQCTESTEMLMPAYLPGTAPIATPDQIILVLGDFRGDVWLMDL